MTDSKASQHPGSADYELLGRQASVEEWCAALDRFGAAAAAGQPIDLDLIARRTIRRLPGVVSSLLSLCAAVATPQALLIAVAAGYLREEDVLRERAHTTADEISERLTDLDASAAPIDPTGALYQLLSRELVDQRAIWETSLEPWRSEVIKAARGEQARIIDLTRGTSSTAGGYLHFLRHRLGDFVLIAGIGGDLGTWAYRLLQLRTDDLGEIETLLAEIPADERQRYVTWVLTPRPDAPTERISFVLDLARREFPGDLDVETLLMLAARPESDLAADALVAAIGLGGAVDPAVVSAALSAINRLPPSSAREVAQALIERSPEVLRLTAVSMDRIALVGGAAGQHSEALSVVIGNQLDKVPSREDLLGWVRVLTELPTPDAVLEQAARYVVAMVSQESDREATADRLRPFLESERFRGAVWTELATMPPDVLSQLTLSLVGLDGPEVAAHRLGKALASLDAERYPKVRATALNSVANGGVDPAAMASVWPERDKEASASEAMTRVAQADVEIDRLRVDLADIDAAMRRELADSGLPVITEALVSSSANPGIQDVYRRLSDTLSSGGSRATEPPGGTASGELEGLGDAFGDSTRLQQVFSLDSSDPDALGSDRARTLLGQGGFAGRVVRDMFERGPMFQMAVRLSAGARSVLLATAMDTGLVAPQEWLTHPGLGDWLRQELAQRPDASGGDIEAAFRLAAARYAVLDSLRREVADKRGTVSRQVAAKLTPLFDELNAVVDSYYQVWRGLGAAGWSTVEVIGSVIQPEDLDPSRHEIVSGRGSPAFVVRRPGVSVDGQVVGLAQLEGVGE